MNSEARLTKTESGFRSLTFYAFEVVLKKLTACLCLFSTLLYSHLFAQTPEKPTSSEIFREIQKLNVLGNVLYMAAHPDDENTTFIAYMANDKLYNTSYLSLTRGDGGQNLIGPEIREFLGMIRTQELLQARKVDKGKQYFSRANDFGFSKNPEETFTIWDKEKILSDAVWVIRNLQPDVIVTRFPPDARAGHGHHSASSILAEEAFDAAADPKRFPDQLQYVKPWQAKRLLWNIGMWAVSNREEFEKNAANYLKIDVGTFNPLLGKSYGEISGESRSMHKSQGFGTIGQRGSITEYLQHTKGTKATNTLFDGINTTWTRVPGTGKIQTLITNLIKEYKVDKPDASVPALIRLKSELSKLPDGFWKNKKLEETDQIIRHVLGLYFEAVAGTYDYTPGEPIRLTVELVKRADIPVTVNTLSLPFSEKDTLINKVLSTNQKLTVVVSGKVPTQHPISQPYWLKAPIGYAGQFIVDNQLEIGLPENPPVQKLSAKVTILGTVFVFDLPVVYKKGDPVEGEIYRPVIVTPPVFVNLPDDVHLFTDQQPKPIAVTVRAGKDQLNGTLKLNIPAGWKAEPAQIPFVLKSKGEEQTFYFSLTPPFQSSDAELKAEASVGGVTYSKGIKSIVYGHIPTQTYFPDATARIVKLDLITKGTNIGYLMGAGDLIPASLKEIGYQVTLLTNSEVTSQNLKKYDAVIVGVRAYNTNDRIRFLQPALLEYVKEGGNLLVQYNTEGGLLTRDLGPYPLEIGRDRVTVEGAPVRITNPDSKILNYPNKITPSDFTNWVQERGLYFPKKWDDRYQTALSSNDPNSPALDSGILTVPYGKGTYTYTSYSWFRQLPAGVPGAYRIFVNLISQNR